MMKYITYMDISCLSKIQNVLDDFVNQKNAAGLNLLVYQNQNELGYWQAGKADIENNVAYNRDTIVRLYSMTKPVTAVAAMILMEEGKLDFADEVFHILPEYANLKVCAQKGRNGKPSSVSRPLQIRDLLNMTSGYTYGANQADSLLGELLTFDLIEELNCDVGESGKNQISTREVARRLSEIPVNFEPGTDYNYGLSADILGAVIQEVSGMRFGEFLRKRIFEPLGMYDTDFFVREENQPKLSKIYRSVENGAERRLEEFTGCNLGISYKMNRLPAFESGGAGLCAPIDDYMKFALMLTNGGQFNGKRILYEGTVNYLSQARLIPELQKKFEARMAHLPGYTYCNLLRVACEPGSCNLLTEKNEFGWDGWLGPYVSIDIKNHLTIVMTMQRCDSGTTSAARKVHNILYSAL
ncbi:MAG: serine hydrolase [Treponema sp.]|nr:serine hydrolase [Treponema sp.]